MALRVLHAKPFSVSKYFSVHALGYNAFQSISALLIPGCIDSKFKGLTRLDRHGSRSTVSLRCWSGRYVQTFLGMGCWPDLYGLGYNRFGCRRMVRHPRFQYDFHESRPAIDNQLQQA